MEQERGARRKDFRQVKRKKKRKNIGIRKGGKKGSVRQAGWLAGWLAGWRYVISIHSTTQQKFILGTEKY